MFVSARQERRTIANSAGQWNINAISQRSLLRQRCQRREKKSRCVTKITWGIFPFFPPQRCMASQWRCRSTFSSMKSTYSRARKVRLVFLFSFLPSFLLCLVPQSMGSPMENDDHLLPSRRALPPNTLPPLSNWRRHNDHFLPTNPTLAIAPLCLFIRPICPLRMKGNN